MDRQGRDFEPQDSVIYAMHGKCTVAGIEDRDIAGESIRFYKLEVQRSTLSRSTRQEPAIWVPVASARERGLRTPLTAESTQTVLEILQSREYYFPLADSWSIMQQRLETSIRSEGALGLAKTLSFLHVLKKKQVVPTPEVNRMYEGVSKLLFRELSEALGKPIRLIEEQVTRGFRQKLLPDH